MILSGGVVAGLGAGVLTYLAAHNPAGTVLAGLPAFAGAVSVPAATMLGAAIVDILR